MPERFTQRIIRLLKRPDYQPLKQRALARALNVPDEDYKAFCQSVWELQKQGKLAVGAGNKISLPQMADRLVGTYEAARGGYGFIRPDLPTAQGDLYIPFDKSLDAATGDQVVACVRKGGKRRGEIRYVGEVVKVLKRATTQIVGTLQKQGRQWFVLPDGKEFTRLVAIEDPSAKDAQPGDKVLVELLSYPSPQFYGQGVIIERLGKSGTSKAELKAIICRYQLPDKFSRIALSEVRRAASQFHPETDLARGLREDIRANLIITIDPTDARDFDDAVSLQKLPQGHWQLAVHIADVSAFVGSDTHLDLESRQRGNSVYLPQHVIPMLPELLSNGICSLQEGQDRFVKTVYILLDETGRVLQTRFANSLIRSSRRLTYEEVDLILEGKTGGFQTNLVKLIKKMEQLARIIQQRRREQGMLTLEMPEAQLVYDDKGRVIDAHPASTTFSHTMIEMFMVEANEAVARLLDSFNVPFLRRIHPEPDSLALGESARIVNLCGYPVPKNINRRGLQDLLNRAKGKPESFLINLAILKSLARAEYSPAPMGHFALASEHYCHFTSPIRRYPDLTVHRLLQAYLQGRLSKKTVKDFPAYDLLEELGRHCSLTERNAEDAEKELTTLKILQMLSNRLGEEFPAVVTSITNFGVFAQCQKFLVEGLIKPEDIPTSSLAHQSAPSRSSRRHDTCHRRFTDWCPYKIGQKIRVRIVNVNLPARTLDLVPVTDVKCPPRIKKKQ